jgi:hypothetical protein
MSIPRAQRPDGWRAQPRAVDDPLELARWEGEGGPVDPRQPRLPVNEAVRDLVRACLIPRVPSDGSAATGDVARRGSRA